VHDAGSYPVDAPLVVAIAHLSDPTVRVRNADGVTPDGLMYYEFTSLAAGGKLAAGSSTDSRSIAFFNPNKVAFTYDLVVLGQLNRSPQFTSTPGTEILAGQTFRYDAAAVDPDGDTLAFSLVSAPPGMTIDAATGAIAFATTLDNLGTQSVTV